MKISTLDIVLFKGNDGSTLRIHAGELGKWRRAAAFFEDAAALGSKANKGTTGG
jgi:hypothetical protein